MIKVLIADGSSYIRVKVRESLEEDPNIEVVGIARNGDDALRKTLSLKPHVIIMGMNMPKVSGVQAAANIMKRRPTPIIMMIEPDLEHSYGSSVITDNGVVDYIVKDNITRDILNQKVYLANKVASLYTNDGDKTPKGPQRTRKGPFHVVGIGISTGGPKALSAFLPKVSPDIGASILIAQHMPPSFTHTLAERLDEICQIRVKEAKDGEPVLDGHAYICPGGMHMGMEKAGFISLYQKEDFPDYHFIPSTDLLISSISNIYGPETLCIIMTGMGTDGMQGVSLAQDKGGYIIAQSSKSSTIFGMPKAVIDKGLQDEILDLGDIGQRINELCTRNP